MFHDTPGKSVLVTVTGLDSPGITSELAAVLAKSGAQILDIGQAVLHDLLSLSILFEMDSADNNQTTVKDLLFKAAELGMQLQFRVLKKDSKTSRSSDRLRYAITLFGEPISSRALSAVTIELAKAGANIDVIKKLSESDFSCVEILASAPKSSFDSKKMRLHLLTLAREHQTDISLQADNLFRRSKRMIVFDMDSTLIQSEVIDELARKMNVFEKVSAITSQAMQGKMDFDTSLKQRVSFLKGLSWEHALEVYDSILLTPGAVEVIKVMKRLGLKTCLISGGFSLIANRLKERLGLDFVASNELEFQDGVCTGNVLPPIVNAQRKADLLEIFSQQERIQLDQVIAVGDGANDIPMLEKAGLGIAFNAKPIVQKQADLAMNQKTLRSILYLLGLSSHDVDQALHSTTSF